MLMHKHHQKKREIVKLMKLMLEENQYNQIVATVIKK
jgi:hypothetical protein